MTSIMFKEMDLKHGDEPDKYNINKIPNNKKLDYIKNFIRGLL